MLQDLSKPHEAKQIRNRPNSLSFSLYHSTTPTACKFFQKTIESMIYTYIYEILELELELGFYLVEM